jgi:hypothetical protein
MMPGTLIIMQLHGAMLKEICMYVGRQKRHGIDYYDYIHASGSLFHSTYDYSELSGKFTVYEMIEP